MTPEEMEPTDDELTECTVETAAQMYQRQRVTTAQRYLAEARAALAAAKLPGDRAAS